MTDKVNGSFQDHAQIQGLAQLLAAARDNPLPPVDQWDPPYCGDIGLRIDAAGTWFYRDSPIQRIAMVKLFARVLRRESDGRHYLVTPVEKVDVHVEDAPFLAVEMQISLTNSSDPKSQVLQFRTNLDEIVQCSSAHPLRFENVAPDNGLKPYLHVRGNLEARVTRALLYDLVELADTRTIAGKPVFGVASGRAFFPLMADDNEDRVHAHETAHVEDNG